MRTLSHKTALVCLIALYSILLTGGGIPQQSVSEVPAADTVEVVEQSESMFEGERSSRCILVVTILGLSMLTAIWFLIRLIPRKNIGRGGRMT